MATQPSTVFLLIDIQEGLKDPTYWGPSRSNPAFEENTLRLLQTYRKVVTSTKTPYGVTPHKIIHVGHSSTSPNSPLRPGAPGHKFQDFVQPQDDEVVVYKNENSAFIGTDLEKIIREHKTRRLWIAGLVTDHCVSTSVRMAGNLKVCDGDGEKGEVILISDATAAFQKSKDSFDAETVHAVHAESLTEFATVTKTDDVIELWKCWIR